MSPVLAILLSLFLVPLCVSGWRVALACLAAQGFMLAWIAYRANPDWHGMEAWLAMVDHLLLRGIVLPFALYTSLRTQKAPYRTGILPANILSWTSAFGAVLLAFNFSALLARATGIERSSIAVVASGILLGFVVLSTRTAMFGQMVGLIFIENAIALFEQTESAHAQPAGIQAGLLATTALTIALYRWLLATRNETKADDVSEFLEGPTI